MIDKHTFGGSKASETLAMLLNEKYPRSTGKVSRIYHKYTKDLTDIFIMWTSNYYADCIMDLLDLHRKKRMDTVNNSNLPNELKSYLLNVMSVAYGEKLHAIKFFLRLNPKE